MAINDEVSDGQNIYSNTRRSDVTIHLWFDDFDDANDGNGWNYVVIGHLGVALTRDRVASREGALRRALEFAPDARLVEGVAA